MFLRYYYSYISKHDEVSLFEVKMHFVKNLRIYHWMKKIHTFILREDFLINFIFQISTLQNKFSSSKRHFIDINAKNKIIKSHIFFSWFQTWQNDPRKKKQLVITIYFYLKHSNFSTSTSITFVCTFVRKTIFFSSIQVSWRFSEEIHEKANSCVLIVPFFSIMSTWCLFVLNS